MGRVNGEKPEPKKKKPVATKKKVPAKKIGKPSPLLKERAKRKLTLKDLPALPPPPIKSNQSDQKPEEVVLLELTDKHLYFCKRYALNGGNASKAARESGFSAWYAANQLVKNSLIIAEVNRYRASRAKKFDISADRILSELSRVAFGTLGDFLTLTKDGTPIIDCSEIGDAEMAALSEITQDIYYERTGPDPDDTTPVKKTKLKMHNKVQALDMLARIFKLYGEADADKDKKTPEEKAMAIRNLLRDMIIADGV